MKLILKQELSLESLDRKEIDDRKEKLTAEKETKHEEQYKCLCDKVTYRTKRAIMLSREKGASAWLTALPLKSLSYTLNKQEFRDSVALRYSWPINDIPKLCACGTKNSVSHTLDCKKGGFVSMRHDAIYKRLHRKSP